MTKDDDGYLGVFDPTFEDCSSTIEADRLYRQISKEAARARDAAKTRINEKLDADMISKVKAWKKGDKIYSHAKVSAMDLSTLKTRAVTGGLFVDYQPKARRVWIAVEKTHPHAGESAKRWGFPGKYLAYFSIERCRFYQFSRTEPSTKARANA